MSGKGALRPFPTFASDQEAEEFVDNADLSEYDFSGFAPAPYEFKAKDATISMRVPQDLLDAVKSQASREGIPYQRFIRRTLERALASGKGKKSA
jgi:predicted DNA binding CopG/RHH family protein